MTDEKAKTYTEKELEQLIRETTKYGAVHVHLFFDAHGKDREAVQASLVEFLSRLTKEKGILYCKGEVMEPFSRELGEEEGFTTSAQVNLLAENFNVLHDICLRYTPVALEIQSPSRITLSHEEAHALLLDASTSSAQYSQYILQQALKPEEYKKLEEQMQRRTELGRQLMEGGKETENKEAKE